MENKRRLVLFIAISLDGYIATENDGLEWLFRVEGEGDNGYSEFYDTVDTILIGRRTYDWVMDHEAGNFPYKNKTCFVFSKKLTGQNDDVTFINNEDLISFINRLKNTEGKNIWIMGGGDLIHSFLKEKLIDEYIITIAPTIIGRGISLFKEIDFEIDLQLSSVKSYNQFVELHYISK